LAAQSPHAGQCKDRPVDLAFLDADESGVDISVEANHLKIGSPPEELGLSPETR
jgi:hypothetical protein